MIKFEQSLWQCLFGLYTSNILPLTVKKYQSIVTLSRWIDLDANNFTIFHIEPFQPCVGMLNASSDTNKCHQISTINFLTGHLEHRISMSSRNDERGCELGRVEITCSLFRLDLAASTHIVTVT